jgi:membrane protease YdiL (CAAX protease family)
VRLTRFVRRAFAHPTACFVTLFGITLAYYYLRRGRLWPPIVAHALFDCVALLDFVGA